jgi:hypothetical protein
MGGFSKSFLIGIGVLAVLTLVVLYQKSMESVTPGDYMVGVDATYHVHESGTAHVEILRKLNLNHGKRAERFDSMIKRMESEKESFVRSYRSEHEKIVTAHNKKANRTMEVRNFDFKTWRTENEGFLLLSFDWTNFSARNGNRWVIDYSWNEVDLAAESSLSIVLPRGYNLVSAYPQPSRQMGRKLTWSETEPFAWPVVRYRKHNGIGRDR